MKRKVLAILAILLGPAGLGPLYPPSATGWNRQTAQADPAAYQETTGADGAKGGLPCWQKPTGNQNWQSLASASICWEAEKALRSTENPMMSCFWQRTAV